MDPNICYRSQKIGVEVLFPEALLCNLHALVAETSSKDNFTSFETSILSWKNNRFVREAYFAIDRNYRNVVLCSISVVPFVCINIVYVIIFTSLAECSKENGHGTYFKSCFWTFQTVSRRQYHRVCQYSTCAFSAGCTGIEPYQKKSNRVCRPTSCVVATWNSWSGIEPCRISKFSDGTGASAEPCSFPAAFRKLSCKRAVVEMGE